MGLIRWWKKRKKQKEEEIKKQEEEIKKQEEADRKQRELTRRKNLLHEVRIELEQERKNHKIDTSISSSDIDAYFQKALDAHAQKQGAKVAFTYFEKAALGGHKRAPYCLGLLYHMNYGPDGYETVSYEDKKENIIKWFTMAAIYGHPEAAYLLGEIYHDDMQNAETPEEYNALERNALKWCSMAADTGLARWAEVDIERYLLGQKLYRNPNSPYIKKS